MKISEIIKSRNSKQASHELTIENAVGTYTSTFTQEPEQGAGLRTCAYKESLKTRMRTELTSLGILALDGWIWCSEEGLGECL